MSIFIYKYYDYSDNILNSRNNHVSDLFASRRLPAGTLSWRSHKDSAPRIPGKMGRPPGPAASGRTLPCIRG